MVKPTRIGRMGDFGSIPTLFGPDGNKYYVSETVREVWRMCDGRRSISALKRDLTLEIGNGRGIPEDIDVSLDGILKSLEEKRLIEYCG